MNLEIDIKPEITALVSLFIQRYDSPKIPLKDIVDCVCSSLKQSSPVLYYGLLALTLLFFFSCLLTHGQSFETLSLKEQQREIQNWEYSSLLFKKKWVQFYKNLTCFIYFSKISKKQ